MGLAGFLGMVSLAVHEPGILYGGLGPAIAGAVNLSCGMWARSLALRNSTGITLTDEARALLQALVARASVWQGGWRPRRTPIHGPHAWPGYRAPVEPPASAMDALERAAEAYNRVADALGDAKDERSSRLRSAADAGMGEALHLAATGKGDVAEIERVVIRLDELAGLVEASVSRPEEVSALRSNLDATLEELRAESEARQELRG